MKPVFAICLVVAACGVLSPEATDAAEQVGQASSEVGGAAQSVGEAASWALYILAAYIAGELRRPATSMGRGLMKASLDKLMGRTDDKKARLR